MRFVIGLNPDLDRLALEPAVEVLESFRRPPLSAVLLRAPESWTDEATSFFGGIFHVFDAEEEARRVWALFGQ